MYEIKIHKFPNMHIFQISIKMKPIFPKVKVKSSLLLFSNTEIFLSRFQLWYPQRIDMKDILPKSNVKSRRHNKSIRHS